MSIQNESSQEAEAVIPEETCETVPAGTIENGINSVGLALIPGGFAVSLVKPEIGYVVMGAGLGLVVGGLAVGYAIRHGNG